MSTPEIDDTVDALAFARKWPAILFIGIVTIGLGVVVLSWPSETLAVLSVLLGLQFVLFGLSRLIAAFSGDTPAAGPIGVAGVLLMISGVIVLRHPFETVAVLATILGVAWIIAGSIDLIHAFSDRGSSDRALRILGGLLSLVAGVVVVAWPTPTVSVIAWISGLYLIIFGLFIAATAFSLRRLGND